MEKIAELFLSKFPFINRRLDPHMREVVVSASVAFSLRLLGGSMTFCFNLLLARTCGAEGAGLYFLAMTVTTVMAVFGCMGLNNSLLRFIAANSTVKNWKAVKGVFSKGIKLTLAVSTLLSLIVYLTAPWLALEIFHKPEIAGPLRWMSLSIAPMSFILLQADALRGLKRIRDWILVSGVCIPAISLAGFYLVGSKTGVTGAVGSYLSASLVTAVIGFSLWRRATPHLRNIKGRFETSELLQSSMPLFWMTLLDTLTNWASILFLGILSSKAEVGIFATASRTAMVVSLILMAVNGISAPKFAALYKKKEMAALNSTARQMAKLTTLLAGPVLLLFILFPGLIMGMFGPEFRSGAAALVILAAGQFINVATGSVGYLLMMSGHEQLLRNRAIFISILCVALNFLLIPSWGIAGAAAATSICVVTTNLIAAYLVWKKLRIWTIPFISKDASNG